MSRSLVKRPTTLPAKFGQGSQRIARIKDLIEQHDAAHAQAAQFDAAQFAIAPVDAEIVDAELADAELVSVNLSSDQVVPARARRATAAYSAEVVGQRPTIVIA